MKINKDIFELPIETKRWFTSYLGLGFLPVAPGTWGSLPPAIIFGLLCYFGVPAIIVTIIMAIIAIDAAVVCILFSPEVIEATGDKDPSEVVVDEAAGQALTFIGAYAVSGNAFLAALIGFGAFRLFDILKPWPIKKLEKLPAGWGILCDDLAAGIGAAVVLQIYLRSPIG